MKTVNTIDSHLYINYENVNFQAKELHACKAR